MCQHLSNAQIPADESKVFLLSTAVSLPKTSVYEFRNIIKPQQQLHVISVTVNLARAVGERANLARAVGERVNLARAVGERAIIARAVGEPRALAGTNVCMQSSSRAGCFAG